MRGELDWIVMKALEKDRVRRYETANGLARDIERYLKEEPVEACPPSAAYRFRKFLRRNKGPVAAAAAVLMALVLGLAASIASAIRAKHAEDEALAAQDQALGARQEAVDQGTIASQQRDEAREANRRLGEAKDELRARLYAAQMNLIQNEWEKDNVPAVRDLLAKLKPAPGEKDLRGFEWHYWDRLSHSELWTIELEKDPVQPTTANSILTADGSRWVALVRATNKEMADFHCHIFDTVNGTELIKFMIAAKRAQYTVPSFACSTNGTRIVISEPDKNVTVWDAVLGKQLCTIQTSGQATQLTFRRDGLFLAGVVRPLGKDKGSITVKVWDTNSGKEVADCQLPLLKETKQSTSIELSWSSDGKQLGGLVSTDPRAEGTEIIHSEGALCIWDAGTGEATRTFDLAASSKEKGVPQLVLGGHPVFSSDGKRIAATLGFADVSRVSADLFKEKGIPDSATMKSFMELLKTMDTRIQVWDLDSGTPITTLKGYGMFSQIAFNPAGNRLAVYDATSGDIKVCDADTGQVRFSILKSAGRSRTVAGDTEVGFGALVANGFRVPGSTHYSWFLYSPDGRLLATQDSNGTINVWDSETGELLRTLKGGPNGSMAFSADSKRLYAGGIKLMTWDLAGTFANPDLRGTVILSANGRRAAEFTFGHAESPMDERASTKDSLPMLRIWDTAAWKPLWTRKDSSIDEASVPLALSQDGKRLLTYNGHGGVPPFLPHLLFERMQFVNGARRPGDAKKEHRSPDLLLLDATTGEELCSFPVDQHILANVVLSPDGKQVAQYRPPQKKEQEGELKIVALDSGMEILRITTSGFAGKFLFSPDGKLFATLFAPTTPQREWVCKLWDTETGKQLRSLGLPVGRVAGISQIFFTPDSACLAAASTVVDPSGKGGAQNVVIFDVASGIQRANVSCRLPPGLSMFAFSPDSRRLAGYGINLAAFVGQGTPTWDELKIWDIATGVELATLKTSPMYPTSLAFSADGHRILLSGTAGTLFGQRAVVQTWDAAPRGKAD
jgi:WD40 repeat protein